MLSKLFKFTIGRKIYAVIGMAFLGFLCVMAFTMRDIRIGMEKEKTSELKHLVEVALSIAKEEHENAQKGTITDEEARKRAAARIGVMRYGNNDYYWINDMHPRMVMHPIQARLNGSDLTENKDPNGKRLFIEFVETVKKSGAGVVAYEWPKPGATAPQPKMSYVAGFQPWGWVIGTGVYIDNLENDVWNMAQRALIFAGIVMLLTGIVCLLVTRADLSRHARHDGGDARTGVRQFRRGHSGPGPQGRDRRHGCRGRCLQGQGGREGAARSRAEAGRRRTRRGAAQGRNASGSRTSSRPRWARSSTRCRRPRASSKPPPIR